jgi:hypothetical protein
MQSFGLIRTEEYRTDPNVPDLPRPLKNSSRETVLLNAHAKTVKYKKIHSPECTAFIT